MVAPVTNPHAPQLFTPAQARFQQSPDNVSKHRALVESRDFDRACDFGMLEYTMRLAKVVSDDPRKAAYMGLKLAGAYEFLVQMRTLSEKPQLVAKTAAVENLDHRA